MTTLKSVKKTTSTTIAEIVDVSPVMAGEWIAKNLKNRNVAQGAVELYATDMRNGDWSFTGEAIKFDADGNLIDGQHRLLALLKSGRTLPFLVVRGLSSEAQDFMDSGKKRSAADMLQLRGHSYGTLLASTARFGILAAGGNRIAGQSVTKAQIADYVDANPDIHDAVRHASTSNVYLPFAPTALAYSWMVLSRIDPLEAAAFFDSLANNATKGKGDPRNTLLRRMQSAKRADERISSEDQVQFIVRAWNACRKGADLHVLKAKTGSTTRGGAIRVSIPKAV